MSALIIEPLMDTYTEYELFQDICQLYCQAQCSKSLNNSKTFINISNCFD